MIESQNYVVIFDTNVLLNIYRYSPEFTDFAMQQYDKNYKISMGESLNEMDLRFNSFINELLNKDMKKSIVVIHGIMLLSFFQNNCDFEFDGEIVTIKYNNKLIVENKLKSPGVYKIIYDNNEIIDIDIIN